MADTYEKDLGQKSSLTVNDFIRVVGSDNVSYKQRVSNVRTTLGIGASASYGSLASFYAEFASMEVNTKYFVTFYDACATALGLPSGTYKGYVSKSASTICEMTVQWYGTSAEYIGRVTFDSSGAVTATNWIKQPTRAEVDALNSNIGACSIKQFSNSRAGGTAEVPLSATGIIFVLSVLRSTTTDASQEGYGLIKCYNNDAHLIRVVGLSEFSVTMSNGNAVITMAPYTNVMLICTA